MTFSAARATAGKPNAIRSMSVFRRIAAHDSRHFSCKSGSATKESSMKKGIVIVVLAAWVGACGGGEKKGGGGGSTAKEGVVSQFKTSRTKLDPRVGNDKAEGRVGE